MAVAFKPGYILGRNDLNIFLIDPEGRRVNAATISYAIYDYTTGMEILIGSPLRTPENPETGEYYAAFRIPDEAPYGSYRARWTFQRVIAGQIHQVVQEFGVVPEGTTLLQQDLIPTEHISFVKSLRVLLRDNCLAFEQPVLIDIDGEKVEVPLGELWEVLKDEC